MGANERGLGFRQWVVCTALLVTVGCEVVPDAPEAQQNRARSFNPPPGKAFVYVLRPARLERAGTPVEMELNTRKFGAVSPKTYLCVAIPPGRHELKVVSFLQPVSQSFAAEAGELLFFEVAPKRDEWSLKPIAESKAREKMTKYRLSGHNTFEAGERDVR
jgi:hypothetical protein